MIPFPPGPRSTAIGDKPLEKCTEEKVLRWRFPEPKGGIVKVSCPFDLKLNEPEP